MRCLLPISLCCTVLAFPIIFWVVGRSTTTTNCHYPGRPPHRQPPAPLPNSLHHRSHLCPVHHGHLDIIDAPGLRPCRCSWAATTSIGAITITVPSAAVTTHPCTEGLAMPTSVRSRTIAGCDGASLEIHLEAVIERVLRCTWRLRLSELRDALGGRDRVSVEMHLETEIKLTQRCTWRP